MSEYLEDKTLNCKDCQQPFTFSGGEQNFFAEKGLSQPVRCKPCRQARKVANGSQPGFPPAAPHASPVADVSSRSPMLPEGGGGAGRKQNRRNGNSKYRDRDD